MTTVRRVALFLGITYGLALLIALVVTGTGDTAPLLSIFCPAIATGIVISFTAPIGRRRIEWSQIGLRHAAFKWWLPAIAIPAAIAAISFGAARLAGVATFPDLGETFLGNPPNFIVGAVISTLIILGEEIGWRGFLLFRLAEMTTLRRAALLAGLAHGLIHLPLLLLTTSYQSTGSRLVIVPVAMVSITAAGVFYAWLRLASGSIWPVAIAHNAFNTAFENILLVAMTSSPAVLAYIAGEGGLLTLALAALTAGWLFTRSPVFNRNEHAARESIQPRLAEAV